MSARHRINVIVMPLFFSSLMAMQPLTFAASQQVYRLDQVLPQLPQPWQFGELNNIALAPNGDVWAQDATNNRLQQLDAGNGQILKQLAIEPIYLSRMFKVAVAKDGSLWKVSNKGQLLHLNADGDLIKEVMPEDALLHNTSLHIAQDDSLWMTDDENQISHYDVTGKLLAQFKNDCTALGNVFPPSRGGVQAQDGSEWIVERVEHRIRHLNADGSVIATIGQEGSGAGQFINPASLTIAADGTIWVADGGNHRFQHFTAEGEFIAQVGSAGVWPSQFNGAENFVVAQDGDLWIADTWNHRIQHLSAKGGYMAAFGNQTDLPEPSNVALASDGSLWVIFGHFRDRIKHFKVDGSLLGEITNASIRDAGKMKFLPDGSFWVQGFTNDISESIQHFTADGVLIEALSGTQGSCQSNRLGEFNTPQGIASVDDGSVWVADKNNDRIQHLTDQGKVITVVVGGSNGLFQRPEAIAVAPDKSVWVVDTTNHRLQQISAEGQLVRQIGGKGSKAGQFLKPSSVALTADGSLWVADTGNRRVQRFTAEGQFIKQFGRVNNDATLEKIFDVPADLAFAADGSFWIGTLYDSALLHLSAAGGLIEQLGDMTYIDPNDRSGNGNFPVPHVGIPAADGSVWQIDPKQPLNIQRIDAKGQVMASIVNTENAATRLSVKRVDTAKDGSVWVLYGNWIFSGKITFEAKWLEHYDATGSSIGKIKEYEGLARVDYFTVAPDGSLWATLSGDPKILHFDATGKEIAAFDVPNPNRNSYTTLAGIAMDEAGALWVADPSNHRIVKFVAKARSNSVAEYDDKQQMLYLNDVVVNGGHYQATLQFQAGLFKLTSYSPIVDTYTSPAIFDGATDFLSIPLVRVMGQNYQAELKHVGNEMFTLKALTIK